MDSDELSDPESISASFIQLFYDRFVKKESAEEIIKIVEYDVFKKRCKLERQIVLDKYCESNFK